MIPHLSRVRWRQTFRLVRAICPPVDIFEGIADPSGWALIAAAEAKTDPAVRDASRAIHLVPPARRVSGPGASWVDAVAIPAPGRHLRYRWNGRREDAWLVHGEEDWRPLP